MKGISDMSYRKRIIAAVLMAGAMVGAGALPASASQLGHEHGCHHRYCDDGWWHHRGWHHDRDDFRHDGWRHDHGHWR